MLSYKRLLEMEEERAKRRINDYTEQRKQRAEEEAAAIASIYNAKQQAAYVDAEAQREQVEEYYREAYDSNVVEELVQRRQAAEAIANSNVQNSGLNNTQQTGISLARGLADRTVTRKREEALQKLMRELESIDGDLAFEADKKRLKVYADAEEDIDVYTQGEQRRMVNYAEKRFKNQGDEETEYKDGTVNAVVSDGPSLNAVDIATQSYKRFRGDEYASGYLDRMLLQGYIDTEAWIALTERYELPLLGEGRHNYSARVARLATNMEEKQVRLYIEYLQTRGLIDSKQSEELRAQLYAR